MRFEFLFLGKTKEAYLAAGIADYAKRLARYIATDIKILKEKKIKKGESENVLIERIARSCCKVPRVPISSVWIESALR